MLFWISFWLSLLLLIPLAGVGQKTLCPNKFLAVWGTPILMIYPVSFQADSDLTCVLDHENFLSFSVDLRGRKIISNNPPRNPPKQTCYLKIHLFSQKPAEEDHKRKVDHKAETCLLLSFLLLVAAQGDVSGGLRDFSWVPCMLCLLPIWGDFMLIFQTLRPQRARLKILPPPLVHW